MKLLHEIFISERPEKHGARPRFDEHRRIQFALKRICESWHDYLSRYVKQTARLFNDTPELPWMKKERAVVSTFSAAIARAYPKSILIEELPIPKKGNSSLHGRCDAWASIPEIQVAGVPFSFYLEAKIFQKSKSIKNLDRSLSGKYGIDKLFRDYQKSSGIKIRQSSPFLRLKDRKHSHYCIEMLMTPVQATGRDLQGILETLQKVFSVKRHLQLKSRTSRTLKNLVRFPTVALIIVDADGKSPGMIASFSVLASTSNRRTGRSYNSNASGT